MVVELYVQYDVDDYVFSWINPRIECNKLMDIKKYKQDCQSCRKIWKGLVRGYGARKYRYEGCLRFDNFTQYENSSSEV